MNVWRDGERALGGEGYVVLFLGGVLVRGTWATVAVGAESGGVKRVLGLWPGCTADAAVAQAAVKGLASRGLDGRRGLLLVHDGSQALDAAVEGVWGRRVTVAHCQECVRDEVLGHLPQKERVRVREAWRCAYTAAGREREQRLGALIKELAGAHVGAAERLQRSCAALCTVSGLGLPASLRVHLQGIGPVRHLAEAVVKAGRQASGSGGDGGGEGRRDGGATVRHEGHRAAQPSGGATAGRRAEGARLGPLPSWPCCRRCCRGCGG